MSPPGPCRVFGTGHRPGRDDGGIRERRVVAGAGIRRHAQRIDRAHEQSVGGGGARAGRVLRRPARSGRSRRHRRAELGAPGRGSATGDAAAVPSGAASGFARPCGRVRTRLDHGDRHRQRNLVSRRQRRSRPIPSARIPSERAVRAVRRHLPRRQAAGARCRRVGAGGRHLRQFRGRHPGVLGGRHAAEIPASRDGPRRAASRRRFWDAPGRPGRRPSSKDASACSRRTCRIRT